MKRLLLSLLALSATPVLFAQVRGDAKAKVYLEVNALPGKLKETYNSYPLSTNYSQAVNATESPIKFTPSKSIGYDAAIGYYFDKKCHLSIQAGVIYFKQEGVLNVDDFHVEYKSVDYKSNTFRQVITANNGIRETITSQHISIPLMLRYNAMLVSRVYLNVDAGILYNTWLRNDYEGKASFDYEAIYQFEGTGTNLTYNYDNAPVPAGQDWLITKAEFMKDNPKSNLANYFDGLKEVGFNVGLNEAAAKKGQVNYQQKNIGYMGQLGFGYLLTKNLMVKAGFYYMAESFSGKGQTTAMLTNKPGEYNSLLNYTKDVKSTTYGITLGVSYNFFRYTDMRY